MSDYKLEGYRPLTTKESETLNEMPLERWEQIVCVVCETRPLQEDHDSHIPQLALPE